jgi:hypothetical protein
MSQDHFEILDRLTGRTSKANLRWFHAANKYSAGKNKGEGEMKDGQPRYVPADGTSVESLPIQEKKSTAKASVDLVAKQKTSASSKKLDVQKLTDSTIQNFIDSINDLEAFGRLRKKLSLTNDMEKWEEKISAKEKQISESSSDPISPPPSEPKIAAKPKHEKSVNEKSK